MPVLNETYVTKQTASRGVQKHSQITLLPPDEPVSRPMGKILPAVTPLFLAVTMSHRVIRQKGISAETDRKISDREKKRREGEKEKKRKKKR